MYCGGYTSEAKRRPISSYRNTTEVRGKVHSIYFRKESYRYVMDVESLEGGGIENITISNGK
jgi:hypothetical protein